jgi:hypothetical protein
MRVGSGIVLLAIALIILYAASRGKLSCLSQAIDCLWGTSGEGGSGSALPALPHLG